MRAVSIKADSRYFLTSALPRVTRIIRSQKLLRAGVEDSLCLLKACEKGKKGGRVKPLPHSPCGA
jgi:hypothetical protein